MIEYRHVDHKFAELLARLSQHQDKPFIKGIAKRVCFDASLGNSCTSAELLEIDEQTAAAVDIIEVVGGDTELTSPNLLIRNAPLILHRQRLYLRKLYMAEKICEKRFIELAESECQFDKQSVIDKIKHLPFMGPVQLDTILKSLSRHLAVITGGPGTGKTTIVVRLLAVLLDQVRDNDRESETEISHYEIALVAPTGKASARLKVSIESQRDSWLADPRGFDEDFLQAIPSNTSTLQRLLKINPKTGIAAFSERRPLKHDVIVVDEASMIDLLLMKQLLCALKPGARLILLGDPYQLASVETGAVLARLIHASASPDFDLDCVSYLSESYRFQNAPAIGKFSAAINAGDTDAALAVSEVKVDVNAEKVQENEVQRLNLEQALEQAVSGYRAYARLANRYANEVELDVVFAAFDAWQVFSPFKSGRLGVGDLNRIIQQGLGYPVTQEWYKGRAIMISENDYALNLFNGDIGLMLDTDSRYVTFPDGAGAYRRIAIGQLPGHNTVFAMTVHKSQGSEFDECLLLVPQPQERQQDLLKREILYTAVTRAKQKFYFYSSDDELKTMIKNKTKRDSGLFVN